MERNRGRKRNKKKHYLAVAAKISGKNTERWKDKKDKKKKNEINWN